MNKNIDKNFLDKITKTVINSRVRNRQNFMLALSLLTILFLCYVYFSTKRISELKDTPIIRVDTVTVTATKYDTTIYDTIIRRDTVAFKIDQNIIDSFSTISDAQQIPGRDRTETFTTLLNGKVIDKKHFRAFSYGFYSYGRNINRIDTFKRKLDSLIRRELSN